jgi:hypothetical protein
MIRWLVIFLAVGLLDQLVATKPAATYKGDRLQVHQHHWHYAACNWLDGQRCQVG